MASGKFPDLLACRLLAAVLAVCCSAHALAQAESEIPPNERIAIERAALGRARTRLRVLIQAQPLKSDLSIGAWAAGDLALDRALRLWVRSQNTYGAARVYSDGSGEADLRLTPAELARELAALREQFNHSGATISAADIAAASKKWPVLWATGVVERLPDERTRPNGWEDVSSDGIELAKRAARDDAIFALVDGAAKLHVTAARRLGEFLSSSTAIEDAVRVAVRDEASVKVELAPDQAAVAEASITIPALIRILTDVHDRLYQGDAFQGPDFREMALSAGVADVRGTGLAAPPARTLIRPRFETIELNEPAWAATTISTTGVYAPEDGDQFPAAMREELARYDGIDRLRKMVEAIELTKGVSVEQFLAYNRQLKDDIVIFLGGAHAVGAAETRPGDGVAVKVELPLRRLWWILRRGMKTIEVEPTSRPAASQPAPAGVG